MSAPTLILLGVLSVATGTVMFIWGNNLWVLKKFLRAQESRLEIDLQLEGKCLFLTGTRAFKDILVGLEKRCLQLKEQEKTTAQWLEYLAHDMRAPLSAMQGYAEIIGTFRTTATTTPNYEYAQAIVGLSVHLDEMITELNHMGKMLDGNIEQETFSLAEMVFELLEMYRPSLKNADIQLLAPEPSSLCIIRGNPSLVQRAVQNLLQNAIRHTNKNGTVEVKLFDSPSGIGCSISNSTPPLPADLLPRIFERGVSSGAGATNRGYGLAIVREIMALHQGTATAQYTESQKLSLSLTFPLPHNPEAGILL